ncbi:annexin A1-like [Chanos chanos]|uniref:Annexin n=1 Tax=Chanos chanos TaxID=29144 RepID=A0A6J2UVG6_CHACN|nr:annexin A1-like [Chanos chanos]
MPFFKDLLKKIIDDDSDDEESQTKKHSKAQVKPYYGTITPDPNFNAARDAAALQKAIETKGVDEQTIVEILVKKSNEQRQQIKSAYEQSTGKPLEETLKAALKSEFEDVVLGLLMTPAQYDAHEIRMSMKGLGTNESVLCEILSTRSNKEITELKKTFKEAYNEDLEEDIKCDTSGDFRDALLALCKADRCEDEEIDDGVAKSDAKALLEAGEKKRGTVCSVFIDVLTSRSSPQLRKVFRYYGKYSTKGLVEALDDELTGDTEDCLMTLVKTAWNTPAYFAERLQQAMKGFGTNCGTLTRILVSRSEVDLLKILHEYRRMYNRTLQEDLLAETKGDYETILLALCGKK